MSTIQKKKKKGMYFTGTLWAVGGSAREVRSHDSRKSEWVYNKATRKLGLKIQILLNSEGIGISYVL